MKQSQKRSLVTATLGLGAGTLVVVSLLAGGGMCHSGEPAGVAQASPSPKEAPAKAEKKKIERFELGKCAPAKGTAAAKEVKANPKARRAAQKGLDFLAKVGPEWQAGHNCYGCHVQAVTIEAFSVGHSNQYNINKKSFDTMLTGMLDLDGGARHHAGGLSHGSPEIAKGAKILGAIAFGRYDEHVNTKLRKELLFEAERILELQAQDGSVTTGWVNAPVSTGQIQYTALAMSTWRRAYERDADDKWLTAIQRAEDWLYGATNGLKNNKNADIQQLDYAVIGFLAAGVGTEETTMRDLRKAIVSRQNKDGGWALHGRGSGSNPMATGQVMYTLRLLGMTDRDKAVKRGTDWLINRQQTDGGWGASGSAKAEAMWAVLGLVSVDVLTVSVDGIQDGTRIDGTTKIKVKAADNKGRGVQKVELVLDDIPVYGACGDTLTWDFDPTGLEEGKHILDALATNAKGETSIRRFEFYTGDVFLTQVGTRFTAGKTEISARNLGGLEGGVEVEIYEIKEKDGAPVAGKKLRTLKIANKAGAARTQWDGKADGGKDLASGKYRARIVARDKKGNALQTEDVDFVHDTLANQKADWAEVQGQLALPAGADAANAEVELVDDLGNVVGRTRSTGAGQYRFKGVASGKKYKVRVKKRGFKAESKAFAPAKAAEEAVDLDLAAE